MSICLSLNFSVVPRCRLGKIDRSRKGALKGQRNVKQKQNAQQGYPSRLNNKLRRFKLTDALTDRTSNEKQDAKQLTVLDFMFPFVFSEVHRHYAVTCPCLMKDYRLYEYPDMLLLISVLY